MRICIRVTVPPRKVHGCNLYSMPRGLSFRVLSRLWIVPEGKLLIFHFLVACPTKIVIPLLFVEKKPLYSPCQHNFLNKLAILIQFTGLLSVHTSTVTNLLCNESLTTSWGLWTVGLRVFGLMTCLLTLLGFNFHSISLVLKKSFFHYIITGVFSL